MKLTHKTIICIGCILALVFSLCACTRVALLKKGNFSPAYENFIKNMQQTPPVSVEFEQYLKPEGFREDKLITDTDPQRIRDLVNALAQVSITEQVESASNFAVRYYSFTDENGEKFTFEFYGEYLKCEDTFYATENSLPFISIRIQEQPSGKLLIALDEAHDGRGENYGKMYISYRIITQVKGKLKKESFGDCELSATAEITAPRSHDDFAHSESVEPTQFFADFEQVKGQSNANYIFDAVIDNGVIVSLTYNREQSAKNELY